MAMPFAVSRVQGDNDRRGSDSTVTRIIYREPPSRDSIEQRTDCADYIKAIYGRGVTSVLKTTVYPSSAIVMKTFAANSRKAASIHLEPRFTPPDCSDAQDLATGKAAILERQLKLARQPRRDSGVEADQKSVLELAATQTRSPGSPKRSRSLEDDATGEAPVAKSPRTDTKRDSSTQASKSPRSSSKSPRSTANAIGPVPPKLIVSNESARRSTSLLTADEPANTVASKPSKANSAEETATMASVIPTTETHVHANEPAHAAPRRGGGRRTGRVSRREDLTIDANFGTLNDASGPAMREFRQGSHWYRVAADTTPEWAEEERPVKSTGPAGRSRNSTARAKT